MDGVAYKPQTISLLLMGNLPFNVSCISFVCGILVYNTCK